MAKGKHAPSKGAVRPDKIIHPNSRKAAKMAQKANKRAARSASQFKIGGSKLQSLGEKLNWFKDNLQFCYNEGEPFTCSVMLTLANAYLSRFQEELDQINLKNSVGGNNVKNRRRQHTSRLDTIEHTLKIEKEEFNGCGLEMPNLFDKEYLDYFLKWEGELRFVQNISVSRYKKQDLEQNVFDKSDDMEV